MKRSSTTRVSRFFLETLVVASNDAGLAKATIDLGRNDVGRRYVGLDPSLPIVLSCAGMRWPRRPKLRSPCCAYDEGRDYWDLATLEIQTFRPMQCSRAQARRLHTTCVPEWRECRQDSPVLYGWEVRQTNITHMLERSQTQLTETSIPPKCVNRYPGKVSA